MTKLLDEKSKGIFQDLIIKWYLNNGRSFYWRKHRLNSWEWLFLELLLRKTRAENVEKVYEDLIKKYPNPETIIKVNDRELEEDLRVLGLYRQRKKALKEISNELVRKFNGRVPSTDSELLLLPHVGPYITNAIQCFYFGRRCAIIDVNVARVLARVNGISTELDVNSAILKQIATATLPNIMWKEYNYGLLDHGALVCTKKNPQCLVCNLKNLCLSYKNP